MPFLGGVDGFDEDKSEGESDKGSEVPGRFLAAERDALEALQFADQLLDAGARPIERLRKESGRVLLVGLVGDHGRDAALAGCRTVGLGGIALVAHCRPGRDVGAEIEENFELHAVAGLALGQMEGERVAIEIGLEVDLGREAPARPSTGSG
jgi:hypothetical protein